MDRRIYSDYFASCTGYLGKEVTELDTIRQNINSALINNSSSEFSDEYLRIRYNSIVESINQKRENIINHQMYLGKRKGYLNSDDSTKAESMYSLINDFNTVSTAIEQMAQDIYASAVALAGDDIGLDAIISEIELEVSIAINEELGDITYDEFIAMPDTQKNYVINKAINLANAYVLDGTLPIPKNGRIELPVAPGITLYCTGSTYTTLGSDAIAVDYNPKAHEECLHIMGGEQFQNTDVSIDASWQGQITYTEPVTDNTSIYVTTNYDFDSHSFFVEKGVNITTDSATFNNVSVNYTTKVGCGVEIYKPSNWKYEPELVRPPIYQYDPFVLPYPVAPGGFPLPQPVPIPVPVI